MQAGNVPYGYFHEVIEKRDGKYAYRYQLLRREQGGVYEENIGALAQTDLTPIALNLNKTGRGAIETTNISYSTDKYGGVMKVEVSGSKIAKFERHISKKAILDVFFPVWINLNWEKLKPGFKASIDTFAEDPERGEFRQRTARITVKGMDLNKSCMSIAVELESLRQTWCSDRSGRLIDLVVDRFHVVRVSGEKEAKDFMSGVLPRKK
jgi:hypothetical protein